MTEKMLSQLMLASIKLDDVIKELRSITFYADYTDKNVDLLDSLKELDALDNYAINLIKFIGLYD